ncbi:MAG: hypothetical protein K8S23_02465 [Candidatus Cloacimonetes bacterium]|nr:hypothetical protein [Candidatus Cloacimonadota bacterium]
MKYNNNSSLDQNHIQVLNIAAVCEIESLSSFSYNEFELKPNISDDSQEHSKKN